MDATEILEKIARGRTDYVLELLRLPDWKKLLATKPVSPLQWLVYYNDLTALRCVLKAGGDLSGMDLDSELGNAAFFGHWKICDFLIAQGAEVNSQVPGTGETPLHSALSKAGRPYYAFTVRVLVENGADVNAATLPGMETGAFMRDVRTKGETPLHRAAAFADLQTIEYLLAAGADKTVRDAHGDSPLGWASMHLRPGEILRALSFGPHQISEAHARVNRSDHGAGWGSGMDWNLFGDYLPDAANPKKPA